MRGAADDRCEPMGAPFGAPIGVLTSPSAQGGMSYAFVQVSATVCPSVKPLGLLAVQLKIGVPVAAQSRVGHR
jgi:hypothetical protein